MCDQGLEARFDPGFAKSLLWDIDSLGKNFFKLIEAHHRTRFGGCDSSRGFGRTLHEVGANVLWIQGWHVPAYWQAVFKARRCHEPNRFAESRL